jgi:hypothetical protein
LKVPPHLREPQIQLLNIIPPNKGKNSGLERGIHNPQHPFPKGVWDFIKPGGGGENPPYSPFGKGGDLEGK